MKQLENLPWSPHWVSHLGCVKGCLDYLGLDVSNGWLFGGTGHAFIINLHKEVCPSGPTAWMSEMLFALGRNLGYRIDGVFASKHDGTLSEGQKKAWTHITDAIDQGLPCYGWELEIPEYYVVYGYDDEGYYFSGPGCDEGKGPKPWQELGDTGIGVLEMYSVRPGQVADDNTVVAQAFGFALEHADSPDKWIFPDYKSGLAGYDNWIRAVEEGMASSLGMAYNAAVWAECRRYAVEFLREAQERIGGNMMELFDEAITHYHVVSKNLDKVAEAYPFSPQLSEAETIASDALSNAASEALVAARMAEADGLQALSKLATELGRQNSS